MTLSLIMPRAKARSLSRTVTLYVARIYSHWLLGIFGLFFTILLAASLVDMLDRAASKEKATLGIILEMALLRVPQLSFEIMPFAILGASIGAFWRLTRTNELVVTRAAGISVWQTLVAPVGVAFLVGVLTTTVINPLSSALSTRFAQMELEYLKGQTSFLSVSKTGLWLRQQEGENHLIIHAERTEPLSLRLEGVTLYRFDAEDRFVSRLDAPTALLEPGQWVLLDAWITELGKQPTQQTRLVIPTEIKAESLTENFAPPETISFWELPAFIEVLQRAGFSAQRHLLQLHRLLALPAYFAAMVILAASFSLQRQRRGGVTLLLAAGVVSGFSLYFLANFIFAFGLAGKLPLVLAAWAPASIPAMLGAALLFHLEDG